MRTPTASAVSWLVAAAAAVILLLAGPAGAQGSRQDANLVFHCQDTGVVANDRDAALKQLGDWCDAKNTVKSGTMAEFKAGNTLAFMCVYGDTRGCNSSEISRYVGGMKAFCPKNEQGASCWDVASDRTFGYYNYVPDRNVCGDGFKKGN